MRLFHSTWRSTVDRQVASGASPRRVASLMPRLGFTCPRARHGRRRGVFQWRRGPTPAAWLRGCLASDAPVLGSAWPQARSFFSGGGAPPPPRGFADASPRMHPCPRARHGRRRGCVIQCRLAGHLSEKSAPAAMPSPRTWISEGEASASVRGGGGAPPPLSSAILFDSLFKRGPARPPRGITCRTHFPPVRPPDSHVSHLRRSRRPCRSSPRAAGRGPHGGYRVPPAQGGRHAGRNGCRPHGPVDHAHRP